MNPVKKHKVLVSEKLIFVIKCNILGCKRLKKKKTHLNKKTGCLVPLLALDKVQMITGPRRRRLLLNPLLPNGVTKSIHNSKIRYFLHMYNRVMYNLT